MYIHIPKYLSRLCVHVFLYTYINMNKHIASNSATCPKSETLLLDPRILILHIQKANPKPKRGAQHCNSHHNKFSPFSFAPPQALNRGHGHGFQTSRLYNCISVHMCEISYIHIHSLGMCHLSQVANPDPGPWAPIPEVLNPDPEPYPRAQKP